MQGHLAECVCHESPIAAHLDGSLVGPTFQRKLQSRCQRPQHRNGGGCQLRDKEIAIVPMVGVGALVRENNPLLIVVEQLDQTAG